MQKSRKSLLGPYNILFIFVIVLFLISGFSFIIGGILYFLTTSEPTLPTISPLQSLIPTNQSGMTQFNLPLPVQVGNLPITVTCIVENLTNNGVCQNAPININVTLSIDNGGELRVESHYALIVGFDVKPTNAIEVGYFLNWNSPQTYPITGSYQPDNPASFSDITCGNSTNIIPPFNLTINEFMQRDETFSGSQDIILQDSGILNLKIQPTVMIQDFNMTDWQNTQYGYYNYEANVNIPISILSQSDANQQSNQIQQQNLQDEYQKLQFQQTINQNIEARHGDALALWILAFASLDIGIALYDHSGDKDKKAEHNARKAEKNHAEIAKRDIDVV